MVLIDTREGLFKVLCYSDKGVGLAEALTSMRWHDVARGLTLPGAKSLQERLSRKGTRLLSTSFTKAKCLLFIQADTSTCKVSGDRPSPGSPQAITYPHSELFKKLGMTWDQDKWVICHIDEYGHRKRITELWHKIAKHIVLERTRKPTITQWVVAPPVGSGN